MLLVSLSCLLVIVIVQKFAQLFLGKTGFSAFFWIGLGKGHDQYRLEVHILSPLLHQETWILHMLMNSIEKPVLTTSGSQLKISCANFRTVTFTIQRDRDAHDVYLSLVELSKPKDVRNLFCFSYKPNKGELRQDTGWNFHDFQAEFQRQVRHSNFFFFLAGPPQQKPMTPKILQDSNNVQQNSPKNSRIGQS